MAKTLDQQLEAETIIRWDETGELAVLWTASSAPRKAGESYGFCVVEEQCGCGLCRVHFEEVTYMPFKGVTTIAPIGPESPEVEFLRSIS